MQPRAGQDDISQRVFGKAYTRKCRDENTIVCAAIECQRADQCQLDKVQRGRPCSSD